MLTFQIYTVLKHLQQTYLTRAHYGMTKAFWQLSIFQMAEEYVRDIDRMIWLLELLEMRPGLLWGMMTKICQNHVKYTTWRTGTIGQNCQTFIFLKDQKELNFYNGNLNRKTWNKPPSWNCRVLVFFSSPWNKTVKESESDWLKVWDFSFLRNFYLA